MEQIVRVITTGWATCSGSCVGWTFIYICCSTTSSANFPFAIRLRVDQPKQIQPSYLSK